MLNKIFCPVFLAVCFSLGTSDALAFGRKASATRPDDGAPLSSQELRTATDELIAILKETNYFDFVDSRMHGWPESNPQYPWWGTFWSGVRIFKESGRVSYVHGRDGADNNGLRTAPYMEGACYAYLLSKDPKYARLTRKMLRGFTGWQLSSAMDGRDLAPKVLNRAFYPVSVLSNDNGREIFFNYDAARNGVKNKATEFVHIPGNPNYGDIYIKNSRSCDDIGHMIRSLSLVESACENAFAEIPGSGPGAKKDFEDAAAAYARWAEDVDANHFVIPSIDGGGNYIVEGEVSRAYTHQLFGENPLCIGTFAIRLLYAGTPGDIRCGSGIHWLERLFRPFLKNDAFEVLRTHQEAAVVIARQRGLAREAEELSRGLVKRVEEDIRDAESDAPPPRMNKDDVHMLLIAAANAGISLTSNEIRWLHRKLHDTYLYYTAHAGHPAFHLFDASTADGEYSYEAPEAAHGIYHRGLGMLLGACASPYRDMSRPLLDCERLREALSVR